LAASPGLDGAAVTVDISRSGTRGDPVTVRVAYDDAVRVPFVTWLTGSSVAMSAEATTRQEFG
jgi:hypothetical protein